jgi:hypothetical protein
MKSNFDRRMHICETFPKFHHALEAATVFLDDTVPPANRAHAAGIFRAVATR